MKRKKVMRENEERESYEQKWVERVWDRKWWERMSRVMRENVGAKKKKKALYNRM